MPTPKEHPISAIDPRYRADQSFYNRLISSSDDFRPVEEVIVEAFTGRGFLVRRGQSIRIILIERPQVADVGLWSADDPTETLSATRTHILEGWFLRPQTRLWSDVPRLRPMATCLADTIASKYPDQEYHHHWVGTHCATEWIELRGGGPGRNSCHLNLLQAIEPFGFREQHIRDNINVHQKSRISARDGQVYGAPSDGSPGDYVELYAEIDLVVGISICPNANNTRLWSDPEDDVVRPLKIQILDTGIEPQEFRHWDDWRARWQGHWEPLPKSEQP